MKVLITGGAGFVGSHLTNRLLEEKHHVMVVDDFSFGKMKFLHFNDNIQVIEGDITEMTLFRSLEYFKPEIVIHLASLHFIPYCDKHPARTVDVNLLGTRNVLNYCRNVKPGSLFFASSAAVYSTGDGALKENDELGPINIYGNTKVIGEDLVRLFNLDTGTKTIIGRLFNVFGPNETNPHLIPDILAQLKMGKRVLQLGNLDPRRDYVYVKDVVDAIINLINKSKKDFDIFNIGSGREYSVKQVVEMLQEVINEKIMLVNDEDKVRQSDRLHLLADIKKIKTSIEWFPKWSFKHGLEELMLHEGLIRTRN